jgi:hypothetical protein
MRKICYRYLRQLSLHPVTWYLKTVHGNGNVTSQQRTVGNTEKIKSMGNFNIDIVQGSPLPLK